MKKDILQIPLEAWEGCSHQDVERYISGFNCNQCNRFYTNSSDVSLIISKMFDLECSLRDIHGKNASLIIGPVLDKLSNGFHESYFETIKEAEGLLKRYHKT